MTFEAESKIWKLQVQDTDNLLINGANEFSCAWAAKNADVTFVETGETEGIVLMLIVK